MATGTGGAAAHRNDVLLVGRLSAAAEERAMPSGDLMVSFRLVVARPPGRRPGSERSPTVDVIDCTAWTKTVQRSVVGWSPGDVVEVAGALRRRFWRSGPSATSRTEVEAAKVRRVARA